MNPEILVKMLFKMLGVSDQMRDEMLNHFVDAIGKVRQFDARLERIEKRLGISETTLQIEDQSNGQGQP